MPFAFAISAASAPPIFALLPFAAMLLAIAVMPFAARRHWERFYPCWAVGLGAASLGFVLANGGWAHGTAAILHTAREYVSFLLLIGSLFVVAGGIHITVKGEARPWMNVLFLLLAAVAANLIGTTGASMLLIRPWLRMNKYRVTGFHVVFFIFIVSNVAGCLTPIGDPPLFLGFLKGVPFWWTLQHCWQPWAVALGLLLAVFFAFDTLNFRRAPRRVREKQTEHETWRFGGGRNVLFLGAILGAVFIGHPPFLREGILLAVALLSLWLTPRHIHKANDFTLEPIREVAWLFLGIFATMIPALEFLQAHAAALGLREPGHFYWATGLLSGVLDNAPTYLAFLAAAFGANGLELGSGTNGMAAFLGTDIGSGMAGAQTALHTRLLAAISTGAVFFGAMTYIGNGPNFMVKSIAERARVPMPGFFAYIVKYSLPILLPILAIVAWLFYSTGR